jgi:hypothetical protein
MSTNNANNKWKELSDFRKRLLHNGYDPIPICGKRPLIKNWQYGKMTEARIDELSFYPTHTNTGLRTGTKPNPLAAIDIDIVDIDHVAKLVEYIHDSIGVSLFIRRGSKGAALLYRLTDEPIRKIVLNHQGAPLVEIHGAGNQLAAYGKHPTTGDDYEWLMDGYEPALKKFSELPPVSALQLQVLGNLMGNTLEQLGYMGVTCRETKSQTPPRVTAAPGDLEEIQARAEKAIKALPNTLDYEQWLKVGRALYNAFGGSGAGCDLWHRFSAQWPTYDERETDKKWRSFRGSRVTALSLFKMADEYCGTTSWRWAK